MGTLYIVSTPIGNLEDITIRALRILFTVPVIACEDTRRAGQLLSELRKRYGSPSSWLVQDRNMPHESSDSGLPSVARMTMSEPKLISYYDEVEEKRLPELIGLLEDGQDIALISDAGTPLISDPGYRIVRECIKRNIPIYSIPGPSSILAALTSSGLPSNQFLFLGYLPPADKRRIEMLTDVFQCFESSKRLGPTLILLESPHRVKETLEAVQGVFGDVEVVIARELTKMHEEVVRGSASEVLEKIGEVKGEVVILCHVT